MDITIIGNDEDDEDWEVKGVAFLNKEQIVRYSYKFIKEKYEYVVKNEASHIIRWVRRGINLTKFIEENSSDYYRYYRIRLSLASFTKPTDKDIKNVASSIGDPSEFIEYLRSNGVIVITDFKTYN